MVLYGKPRKTGRRVRLYARPSPFRHLQRAFRARRSSYGHKKILATRYRAQSKQPSKGFKNQMNKYERRYYEKIIIPYKNYTAGKGTNYLQAIPPVGLVGYNIPGGTDPVVSCLVLQTGNSLTDNNTQLNQDVGGNVAWPIGGYAVDQSLNTIAGIIGRYAKISSSKINFNVQMDPVDNNNSPEDTDQFSLRTGAMLPHSFRYLKVQAKRNNSVPPGAEIQPTGLTADLGENLFLDEAGNTRGLSQGVQIPAEGGAPQDPFTWMVNKQKWTLLEEKRFTLATCVQTLFRPSESSDTSEFSASSYTTGIEKHPVQKFFSTYNPKVDRRVRWGFQLDDQVTTTEPIDMNYNFHHIFLSKVKGGSGLYNSDNWTIQVNGCTSLIDV